MNAPFDPGLQPERTALAWRRTGLALLVGSFVAARILPELLGAWSALLGLTGVVISGILLAMIHRRYRGHHGQLTTAGDRAPIADGRLIAATAAFVFGGALVSIIVVIVLAVSGALGASLPR